MLCHRCRCAQRKRSRAFDARRILLPPLSRTTLTASAPNGPAEAREAHMDFIFMLTAMTRPSALPPRNRPDRASRITAYRPQGCRRDRGERRRTGQPDQSQGRHLLYGSGQHRTASCGLVDPDGRQDRRRSGPGRSGDRDGDAGPARNRYRILSVRRAALPAIRRISPAHPIAEDCHRARATGCSGVDLLAYRHSPAQIRALVALGRTPSPSGRAPQPSCFWLRMYDNTASRCASRLCAQCRETAQGSSPAKPQAGTSLEVTKSW